MLNQDKIEQIKSLLASGNSITEISRLVGISTVTVYKYKDLMNKDFNFNKIILKEGDIHISYKLKPYIGLIDNQIKNKVYNSVKIYQILKENGFVGSYSLVNSYIRKRIIENKRGKRLYQRVETASGEQAQVDWGNFGKININGNSFNLYAFIYILSYSRIMYAEFVTSQKQRIFQECHIHAFEKLGVPKKIRYDNLKTVVISRKKTSGSQREHIVYNFDFSNFAKYYKFESEICPPYYPRSKGKVEAGVKYIRYNFMKGQIYKKSFESIDDLNQNLWLWLDNFANKRIHATTKEQPYQRWLTEKKDLFMVEGYPRYQNDILTSRRASQNFMVTYKKSAYWVPPIYARKKIEVQETIKNGEIKLIFYFQGNKIIEYPISNKTGEWIIPKDVLIGNLKKDKERVKKNLKIDIQERDLNYYNKFINNIWEEKK